MKRLFRTICIICLLVSLVPALSAGPLKMKVNWKEFHRRGRRLPGGYFRNKPRHFKLRTVEQKSAFASYQKGRVLPSTMLAKKGPAFFTKNGSVGPRGPWGIVEKSSEAAEAAAEEEPQTVRLVRLAPPEGLALIHVEDIWNDAQDIDWDIDPEGNFSYISQLEPWKKIKAETQELGQKPDAEVEINAHISQLVGDLTAELDNRKDAQIFVTENPFESVSMEKAYELSDEIFARRPIANLPIDFRFTSLSQQIKIKMSFQEKFYFDEFPNCPLVVNPGHIRPTYLRETISFYLLVVADPHRPLYQRVRALTMLGFLGRKGDGLAETILIFLKEEFVDPPWTVDYAAGMALLNLGEAEKFDELVQWRQRIEAGKPKRTPGIAWLYSEVFSAYEEDVQVLGQGMPYMRPDTLKEMITAMEQLEDIRQYAQTVPEQWMWKLENVRDMVVFLQFKGLVLQRVKPPQEGEDPPAQ